MDVECWNSTYAEDMENMRKCTLYIPVKPFASRVGRKEEDSDGY